MPVDVEAIRVCPAIQPVRMRIVVSSRPSASAAKAASAASVAVLSPCAGVEAGNEIVAGATPKPSTCHEPEEMRSAIGAARWVRAGKIARLVTGTIVVATALPGAGAEPIGALDASRRSPTPALTH